MMIWRRGVVRAVDHPWPGVQQLQVELDEGFGPDNRTVITALSYLESTGEGEVGDEVIVTAAALHRGLGTGGYAFVTAFPGRLPRDPTPSPGHIVKARYTPFQTVRLGVDEQESQHHALLARATTIDGMPVIVADLHSALPAIIAGLRASRPRVKVAYLMTDGAALPYAFSRSASLLTEHGWIASSITVGQAFGGDLEAVNVYTGLLAAKHVVGADVTVVAQGPGNLGTGTPLGFSGTQLADVLHAVAVLEGRPVGSLRVSGADHRERHHGVSHHSTTVYQRLTHVPITVVHPVFDGDFGELVSAQVEALRARHTVVDEPLDGLSLALGSSPVPLSTMGRSITDDPAPFLAAAAAGRWVGRELLTG